MSTSGDRYNPGVAYIPSTGNPEDDRYIVMTKIMVLAMAVLFAAVFFVICLHIYTKWIWGSAGARRRDSFWFWPRRRRGAHRNEHAATDMLDINTVVGLGKEAVEALPTFKYRKEEPGMECAICLGQFQEEESGRSLPKCGHSFHLECIDMWLFSNSTCPLCRAVLQEAELDADHEPISEASSIQVFTQSSNNNVPAPEEEEQEPKRADSIPANVLFWGNLMQQVGAADSRNSQHRNNNNNITSQQIAIDIDNMGTPRARTPRASNPSSS